MNGPDALADLMEISSQVEAAVLIDASGAVIASSLEAGAAEELARCARELLEAGGRARSGPQAGPVRQLHAATGDGSFFVVRDGDHVAAATTGASPTVGLVFYDLKTCLRALAGDAEKGATGIEPGRAARALSDGDEAA